MRSRVSKIAVYATVFLAVALGAEGNTRISSFMKARRLALQIAEAHPRTLYCDCAFAEKVIDRASCGYVPLNDSERARRIEIEHVVPAENFGRSFKEWREGHEDCQRANGKRFKGRRCAGKVNETYRLIEADLYNLYPEIGELNADRRNYRYGIIAGEARRYGKCDFEVEDHIAEPRETIRGDIARIYFIWTQPTPTAACSATSSAACSRHGTKKTPSTQPNATAHAESKNSGQREWLRQIGLRGGRVKLSKKTAGKAGPRSCVP
jgi:deoxyribonuclease-1